MSKFFKFRTEKQHAIHQAKLERLKADRDKHPKKKEKPLKIIDTCKVYIEVYQKHHSNPVGVLNMVDEPGSSLHENEPDALLFKKMIRELNEDDKSVRDFFLKKNLQKFDKDPNKICKLCVSYKAYKDTGICEGWIYPVKNWDKKQISIK